MTPTTVGMAAEEVLRLLASQIPILNHVVARLGELRTEEQINALRSEVQAIVLRLAQQDTFDIGVRNVGHVLVGQPAKLRRADSCLAIMKLLSFRSRFGQDREDAAYQSHEELLAVLRSFNDPADPHREMELAVHEMSKMAMIEINKNASRPCCVIEGISPCEDFFWRTDRMFHPWDAEADARALCEATRNTGQDHFFPETIDQQLHWGPRRFNPALAYMAAHGLSDPQDRGLMGFHPYFPPTVRLETEEVDLWLSEVGW